MVDLYGFPHTSRIFYLKDSAMQTLFEQLRIESRFPHLTRWHNEIRASKVLNDGKAIIIVRAFHLWLEELMTSYKIGTKPPLRLPMKL